MQNDFAHPQGALYVPGGKKLIPRLEELIQSGEYDLIIATMDWHPKNHYSFKENGGLWPKHCVQVTWGAKLLIPAFPVILIAKGTDPEDTNDYSGFSGRSFSGDKTLQEILTENGIKEVDIVGLALDYCVKSTALDAVKLGFKTNVLLGYTKAVNINPDDGVKAVKEMREKGIEISIV